MKLVFFLSLLILTGCCAAETCDCPGQEAADDIRIRFNRDTLGPAPAGFTRNETARLLFIREPLDTSSGARTDTLLLDPHPVPAAGEPDILLRRDRPFTRSVIGLGGYRYRVQLLRKPGLPLVYKYELRDVLIESRFNTTSECCTCYENLRKEVRLDSDSLLDLRAAAGGQPTFVELRKR